jgi:hypothetical protein
MIELVVPQAASALATQGKPVRISSSKQAHRGEES